MYCIAHCTVRAILYTKNVQDEKTKTQNKKSLKNAKISFQLISSKKKKMGRQYRLLLELTAIANLTNDLVLNRKA